MRTFVLTDIHGNNTLFRKALKEVRLKKSDKLILLGDIIDRGEDSKAVLDTILLLKEHGFSIDILMGNHEELFLNALEDSNSFNHWMLNGGDKTLASFLTSQPEKIPKKYITLIKSFRYYLELGNFIFVHAAINMCINDPFEDKKTMLWEREPQKLFNAQWLGQRQVIHGHQPQSNEGIMESIHEKKAIIGIDNGVYLKRPNYGGICILELEDLNPIFVYED